MSKYSVAVVGAGYWGPNLIRNFAANALCRELWVCERDAERLEKIKSRFPGIRATQSFEQVLESDVDALVLATPVGTHYQLAMKAMEAGKHVFVEKPMASSVDTGAGDFLIASLSAVMMASVDCVPTSAINKRVRMVSITSCDSVGVLLNRSVKPDQNEDRVFVRPLW